MPSSDISDLFWLQHRPPGQALAEGVNAGSQIRANFLRGVQIRQQQEQFEAEMPLRWAQIKNQQDRTIIDEANTTAKQKMDNELDAGYGALGSVVATVGNYQDGWLNPEFREKFWSTVSRYPKVARDPGFRSMTDNFDIAERAAARAAEERLRIQGRSELETQKQVGRVDLENTRQDNRIEITDLTYDRKAELQEDAQQFKGEEGDKNRKARSDIEQAKIDARIQEELAKAKKRLADVEYRGVMTKMSKVGRDPFLTKEEAFSEIDKVVDEFKLDSYGGDSKLTPAQPQSGPAKPTSKADFDSLPSGAEYINPKDGKVYRKK